MADSTRGRKPQINSRPPRAVSTGNKCISTNTINNYASHGDASHSNIIGSDGEATSNNTSKKTSNNSASNRTTRGTDTNNNGTSSSRANEHEADDGDARARDLSDGHGETTSNNTSHRTASNGNDETANNDINDNKVDFAERHLVDRVPETLKLNFHNDSQTVWFSTHGEVCRILHGNKSFRSVNTLCNPLFDWWTLDLIDSENNGGFMSTHDALLKLGFKENEIKANKDLCRPKVRSYTEKSRGVGWRQGRAAGVSVARWFSS